MLEHELSKLDIFFLTSGAHPEFPSRQTSGADTELVVERSVAKAIVEINAPQTALVELRNKLMKTMRPWKKSNLGRERLDRTMKDNITRVLNAI